VHVRVYGFVVPVLCSKPANPIVSIEILAWWSTNWSSPLGEDIRSLPLSHGWMICIQSTAISCLDIHFSPWLLEFTLMEILVNLSWPFKLFGMAGCPEPIGLLSQAGRTPWQLYTAWSTVPGYKVEYWPPYWLCTISSHIVNCCQAYIFIPLAEGSSLKFT